MRLLGVHDMARGSTEELILPIQIKNKVNLKAEEGVGEPELR